MHRVSSRRGAFVSIAILLALISISFTLGAAHVDNVWNVLLHPMRHSDQSGHDIIWNIRFPRIVAALLIGATLGAAGVMAQGACNNPLAEPSILGTSAGAATGVLLGVLVGAVSIGSFGAVVCGALGGFLATMLTFTLASRRSSASSMTLVIVGIAVSAMLAAVVGVATSIASRADARSLSFWNFGSMALVTNKDLIALAVSVIAGLIIAARIAPSLDVLSLGDDSARHRGFDSRIIRFVALGALSLLVGASVSTVGSIAFVGLAAPHIARFLYGPTNRTVLFHGALIGAAIVLAADTAARTVASPNELPIGLLTSLIGAPVLIALVSTRSSVWKIS